MSWDLSKARKLGRLKILGGSHFGAAQPEGADKRVCIMEAVNYIQHGQIDDDPPCVSITIRDLMIDRNDHVTDSERQKLKKLVPEVIHTAPTRRNRYGVERNETSQTYQRAEGRRQDVMEKWRKKYNPHFSWLSIGGLSTRQFNRMIRELANVPEGKFED